MQNPGGKILATLNITQKTDHQKSGKNFPTKSPVVEQADVANLDLSKVVQFQFGLFQVVTKTRLGSNIE